MWTAFCTISGSGSPSGAEGGGQAWTQPRVNDCVNNFPRVWREVPRSARFLDPALRLERRGAGRLEAAASLHPAGPRLRHDHNLISQNALTKWFYKVNFPTKSSTYGLLTIN